MQWLMKRLFYVAIIFNFITGTWHAALTATEIDECRKFYSDLFKMQSKNTKIRIDDDIKKSEIERFDEMLSRWDDEEEYVVETLSEYLNFSKKIIAANNILKLQDDKSELFSCVSESKKFSFCLGMKPENSTHIVQPDPSADGTFGDGKFEKKKFSFSWNYGTKVVRKDYWYSSGDPWYDIGSASGATNYRVYFNQDYSKFKYSTEAHETVFKGNCKKIDRLKLLSEINPIIKNIYYNELVNESSDKLARYTLKDNQLFHISGNKFPNLIVTNLSSNNSTVQYFEKILEYKPLKIKDIAQYLTRHSNDFNLSDYHNNNVKMWNCLFFNDVALQKPNFFQFKIRKMTNTGLPSGMSGLGYSALAMLELVGKWPENSWLNQQKMIVVDGRTGEKVFIGKNNKLNSTVIYSSFKEKSFNLFGLNYEMLRINDLLCLSN